MSPRYTERREFGPSIEWYELPIVGAPVRRRRPWKAIAAAALLVSALLAGWLAS